MADVIIRVAGVNKKLFERMRVVARQFGAVTDAAVARFVFEQFAAGRSLRDFEPSSASDSKEAAVDATGAPAAACP